MTHFCSYLHGSNVPFNFPKKLIVNWKPLPFLMAILLPTFDSSFAIDENEITIRQKIIRQSNNILSSPIFETMRKIDQYDSDDLVSESTTRYFLLLPIVDLYEDILSASKQVKDKSLQSFQNINFILTQTKFDKGQMKKTFNRYGDNIYYSSPERANIYLAGGALPGTVQTEQYMLRNDVITNVENLREDIANIIKQPFGGWSDQEIEDMADDFRETLQSLESYLDRTNPDDLKFARILYTKQKAAT